MTRILKFHSTQPFTNIRKIHHLAISKQLLSLNKALIFFSVYSCTENGIQENVSLSFTRLFWVISVSSTGHDISFCSLILKMICLRLKKRSNLACTLIGCCQGFWKNKDEKEEKKGLINLSLVIRNLILLYNGLSLFLYYFFLIES